MIDSKLAAAQQILSLTPSAELELFELDLRPVGEDTTLYFHNGVNGFRSTASFQGISYVPMPISVTGYQISTSGEPARPRMIMSNIGGFMSNLSISTNDLVGAILTRKRTWHAFLDDQPNACAAMLGDPDVFVVERRVGENELTVEFELTTPYDLDGAEFPIRKITSGYCPFVYRGEDCNWAGRYVVADRNGAIFNGALQFAGDWNSTTTYEPGQSVGYTDGGYYGVYLLLSTTAVTGETNVPTNVGVWKRVQRYRGEYSATEAYATDDVVFLNYDGVQLYFISVWPGTMPPGMSPPSQSFWKADVCSKFLRHCSLRFDPLNKRKNPLPYGGFPGTINVPNLS